MNRVIVYMDIILLFDLLINFLFLRFIEKVYSEKVNNFKLLLISFIGSLLIIPVFFSAFYMKIMKVIGGIILIILLCKTNEKSKIIIKISLFYALNFGLVGILTTFKITKWYYLLCGIIVILILFALENYRKYHIFIRDNEYNVIIENKEKIINIKGLLDTGNLSSYLGYPIVYLNKKYNFIIEDQKKVVLEIESVGGVKSVYGYIYKNFLFKIKDKKYYRDVILVLSDISVDCLLNPMLML